ncbi:glucosamine-6-phosphate deaminase [Arthrobacter sp. B3I4]|uniref:glucosamine-6-phosphate deaminase n=1 Tax=Arthrobacter sp. B3I4 TaxID=3042267 RepID=UPI00278B2CF2|nr:glucosamine-6-phosphate deaminase [Arthrobacter sp. B3I4]MDQ0755051.1 glucosamine-6-phosphate deaminase [Arthrobacter sp. B3I4]
MEVIIAATPGQVGCIAAGVIAGIVGKKPDAVLGLATGSSPMVVYAELARMRHDAEIDLVATRGFALDEYVGLAPGHPARYAAVVQRDIVEPLGMTPENVTVPDGGSLDHEQACRDFEAAISRSGGVDVQILGIGTNGHIGFNEPTSSLTSRTRVKTLTEQTRADNARFFNTADEVPRHCITQGLGTIFEARQLLLVAQGKGKARALAAAIEGPLSSMCPASLLQLHPRATVVIDEAAAGDLALTDYYRYAFDNKPASSGVRFGQGPCGQG